MNSKWLKIGLIISLGLNCMIAGALVYHFVLDRPLGRFFSSPPRGHHTTILKSLPPESRAAHKELRKKMRAERRQAARARHALMDLLAEPEPDRGRIDAQLELINRQRAHMGRMVVGQMLEDIKAVPPDQRAAFIDSLRQSKYFRAGRPGRGRGAEGRGGRSGRGRGMDGRGGRHRSDH